MEFKAPYLQARREKAPKMFNHLRRSGGLDAHLQKKSAEAHQLFEELTAAQPKPLTDQAYNEAARQVIETLAEFPIEIEPSKADPLGAGAIPNPV